MTNKEGASSEQYEQLTTGDLVEGADCTESHPTPTNDTALVLARIDDEASQVRLEVARNESLRQDLDWGQTCLDKMARALEAGKVSSDRHVLEPSILLFPLPRWDQESRRITCDIFPLDVEARPDAHIAVLQNLRQMHRFASSDPGRFPQSEMSFPKRVNLITALTIFCEEMTDVNSGAEEGLPVNYPMAASDIALLEFRLARKINPTLYCGDGKTPVILDGMKMLELQAKLRWYFEQKEREKLGYVRAGSSIDKVKLAGLRPIRIRLPHTDVVGPAAVTTPPPGKKVV